MRSISVFIILYCLGFSSNAQVGGIGMNQVPGIGKIYGQVIDSISKEPLAYANIVLREALEDIEKDGQLTSDNGKFIFKELKGMKYEVVVSFLGYRSKILGPYKINKETIDHNLGKIELSSLSLNLDEVIVTGEKELIENKIDRIVYNAERDITSKGGNAADVLRKTPLLTVDMEGNVSLRGSANIKILINGKPSSIMAGSVPDAMKMIPADVIQKVEVITQPGAKYDAEGSAGIINIITKTKKVRGTSGSFNVSAGTRSNFLGLNLSSRANNIGFSANIGGHMWRGKGTSIIDRTNQLSAINSVVRQEGESSNIGGGLYTQVGMDYDINDKNSLTLSLRTPINLFANDNTLTTFTGVSKDSVPFDFRRVSDALNRTVGADVNLDYKKTFSKDSDREFSLSSQYSYSNRKNDYTSDEFNENSILTYRELSPNLSNNRELIFAADYLHPVKKDINLEIGAKTILRNVDSDIYYDTLNIGTDLLLRDNTRNNYFIYGQNVAAGYTQITFPIIKNLTGRAGIRYEHTFIDGDVQNETSFGNDYATWVPSGLLSYVLKKNTTMKLSYSRRIQRPSMFYLNPYINYNDPTNISFGNPELKPEITESFEATYGYSKNFNNINISVYHKITNDLIDNYRYIDSLGIINSTYNNLATNYSSGVSINGGIFKLGKIILNSTLNIYYQKIVSEQFVGVKSSAYNFSLNGFANVNVTPVWGITLFGLINSPKLTTQGKQATWFVYNVGVRRDLWKKKGGISIGIDNPFHPKMNLKTEFSSSQFSYVADNKVEGWGIRASLDYRFGKMEFGGPQKKKRKGNLNDDLKKEEGEGQNSGSR